MKKLLLIIAVLSGVSMVGVMAIDSLSRTGEKISVVQSGTSTTNGRTLLESTSSTNLFRVEIVTCTVAGAATAATNTFSTAYVATPTIVPALVSGTAFNSAGYGVVVPTATTSGLIVTGMNSAGTTNNLNYLIYGYTRTGKFP